jgi:hypothetical protein
MGTNVRLEVRAKLRLSVEAMGRSEWLNMSARWTGRGEVEGGVGAVVDAMEPAEERLVMSA